MTFDKALKLLEEKYPKTYKALRFEKSIGSDGSVRTGISIYVSDIGWSNTFKTFEDAIKDLESKTESPAPAEDC